MSLKDKNSSTPPNRGKRLSVVATWINSLSESEREEAVDMLKNPEWGSAPLLRAFNEEGLEGIKISAFKHFRQTYFPEGMSLS